MDSSREPAFLLRILTLIIFRDPLANVFRSGFGAVFSFFFFLAWLLLSRFVSISAKCNFFVFFFFWYLRLHLLTDDELTIVTTISFTIHIFIDIFICIFVYTTGDVGSSRNFKPKLRRYYYLLFVYSYEVEHEPSHCSQNELALQSSNIDVS